MRSIQRLVLRLVPVVLVLCCPPAVQAVEKTSAYLAALESISAGELKGHVGYLADDRLEGREAGRRGGRAAGDYLKARLEELGLQPAGSGGTFFQPFGSNYRNVLAMLPGSNDRLRGQIVVVSAHYDHVGYGTRRNSRGPVGHVHNGADDNASGTSALLELARAFTMLAEPPKRTVLFAFWDAEEKGLLGSKHWTAHPTMRLDRIAAEISMDMIGRLRNDRLTVFGSRSGYGWRRLVSLQNEGPHLLLDFTWELKANADHYPFFQRSIPVLLLHTGKHAQYHTPYDDAKLIDAEGMSRVTRLLFGVVYDLADREHLPRFRKAARHEGKYSQRHRAVHAAGPTRRLGVRWNPVESAAEGLRLTWITRGSAAQQAGLRLGDRVVRFADRDIRDGEHLRRAVLRAPSPAKATVVRPGEDEPLELLVRLPGKPVRLGISWRLDDAEPGTIVLTQVIPGSPAAVAGLRVGDRIYRIAGQDFVDYRHFAHLAKTLPEPLELSVERNGRLRTVVLYIDTEPMQKAA